jgi:hypothetical protein
VTLCYANFDVTKCEVLDFGTAALARLRSETIDR